MFLPISQHGILVWTIEPRVIGKWALEHQSPKTAFILPCNTTGYFGLLCIWGKGCNSLTKPEPACGIVARSGLLSSAWHWALGAPAGQGTAAPCPLHWALGCVLQQVASVPSTVPGTLRAGSSPGSPSSVPQPGCAQCLNTTQPCHQHFPRKHWETALSWNYNGNGTLG